MNDTTNARAETLARIRSAMAAPSFTSPDASWHTIRREYRQLGVLDSASRIALLEDRLREFGAGVHRSATPQISSAIAAILQQRDRRQVLVPTEIDPTWLPPGFSFVPDRALSYRDLDLADGVLTGCSLAIALTGTIVLCHGVESPPNQAAGRRALTLVPDYHLCVVETSSVVETVPQGFLALGPCQHRPITLISGPSATADIEMTRIQGVHGPRVLDVLIVG